MSFVILGSHGFVAQSLKNFLISKNKKYLAISKNQINFLKKNSSLKLKKILKKKEKLHNGNNVIYCTSKKFR